MQFLLAKTHFALQSSPMETNWAVEHLQTIRTLMERSAVYRRALAPIMIYAGCLGTFSAALGLIFHLEALRAFFALWFLTAAVVIAGAFLIARRQALKENEPFWSPPTRRIAQAIAPPLTAGMVLGLVLVRVGIANAIVITFIWLLFYGCALNAAGFFMPRGMKVFGWGYIALACICLLVVAIERETIDISAHWLMGFFFGVLHLAYGAYLFLTEKGKNAA
jgi:hypothetical protein